MALLFHALYFCTKHLQHGKHLIYGLFRDVTKLTLCETAVPSCSVQPFHIFSGLARGRAFYFADAETLATGLLQTNISFVILPVPEGLSLGFFLHGVSPLHQLRYDVAHPVQFGYDVCIEKISKTLVFVRQV